jgi:cysteine desulfurase NifS
MKEWAEKERCALCGICPAGCWVVVSYDGEGKISTVRADESSPLGILCRLGEHSPEIVYSRDRVLYPLKRKGAKGTFDFQRITWEEAFETIVARLRSTKAEHGPEAAAIYTGRGSFELSLCDVYQPKDVAVSSASSVLFPFGSPNTLGVGALCYVSFAMIAPHVTMGGMLINMFSDMENSDLIVVWGANPATDCPPYDLRRIAEARRRGADVVVIDPRRTRTAKITDAQWIPIRPGTDGALALGMCNVLIDEELYDERFVTEFTEGFDEFARYVQHFRPEVVEEITRVPAETVVSLARRVARARGASPVMYSGLEYSESGVQAIRATQVLWALAGQLDVPGGRCFSLRENQFPVNREGHVANPDVRKALGRDRFPVYSAYRGESHAISLPESVLEGKPYRIHSLIVLGGSLITAWPRPSVFRKTLGALDFLVSIDRQLTADAAYADIVLPATTMYEIESYMTYGPVFRIREKVIEPLGEARNDFFILAELARRLGYGNLYPQSEEELLRHVLRGSGFSLEDVRTAGGIVQVPGQMMEYKKWEKGLLRPDGKAGFHTPTGRFEICSSVLEEHGYDGLPVYTEPREGPVSNPALAGRYPLIFNSGSRVTTDFRSQHHGIPGLLKERPEPTVTINSEDAEERGIRSGDLVSIKSPRGEVSLRAYVTDDIMKGTVDANMGGGGPVGPDAWRQCNINELTDLKNYDPISGFPVYKALLCDVVKVSARVGDTPYTSGEDFLGEEAGRQPAVVVSDGPRAYLDHNATTPIHAEVKEIMKQFVEDGCFGNPSSIHAEGRRARSAVDAARRSIAQLVNATARRIIFTGGGSEANNLALKGIAFALWRQKNHVITSSVEHPSVLNTCRWLEGHGFRITYLPVDSSGKVSPEDVAEAITEDTCLVSVMAANNETGALQPVDELALVAREKGVLFHTDAVQAGGKVPLDVEALGVDLLSLSGHKIHGPKGVGVLYVRRGVRLEPVIHGGGQEGGLRGGTENVTGLVGFGRAADLARKGLPEMERVSGLRDALEDAILELLPGSKVNGRKDRRLPNTSNISLAGMRGESVVLALDRKGVSLSSGSACRSGSPKPSHALLAMGLTEEEAHCAIRISLGVGNSEEDIDFAMRAFREVIHDSERALRFVPCR